MSEKHSRHSRHHHHHHKTQIKDDSSWWWIIGILVFAAFFLVIFLVPWRWPPPPPPVKEQFESSSQEGGEGPFVFRKRIAPKRSDRHGCKTGEMWSVQDNMCAPIFNTPSSFEGSIMNITMNMCDDFFNSMCGRWNAEHINEDRTFSYGYHRNQAAIKRLVLDTQNKEIRSFYDSCIFATNELDTHESELETKHVLEHIAGSLKGYGDLPTVLGRLARYGYTSPFIFSIERDPTQKRLIPFFTADSFNFTSPIVVQTFEEARSVTKHTSLVLMDRVRRTMKVIQHLNSHNTEPIEGIVDYMDYLKTGITDDFHLFRDLGVWNTPHENSGGWTLFFQALDGSALRLSQEQPVWVIGFPYMQWLLKDGLRGVEVMDWLAFVEFSVLYNTRQFYPSLQNNVYVASFLPPGGGEERSPLPKGIAPRRESRIPRGSRPSINKRSLEATLQKEEYCVQVTQNMLPGLVAQTFLRDQMPKKDVIRAQVKEMVGRIINVYRGFIQGAPWLRQGDKDAALKKLDTLVVRVIEPDEWEAEPFAQRISSDRYDHNMNMIRRYRVHRNVQQWHLNKEPELSIPFVAPLTDVNAYYSGPSNSITVLAGILQKPFYNIDYDEVTRYAIVGSIIGHELGHMFDPHGLLWDEGGAFKPNGIWSRDGMISFREKTRCVKEEYGDVPEECVPPEGGDYGESILGESMSDLIGIRLSYKALFDNADPSGPKSSGNRQYFFMSFAQAWCSSYDTQHKCALVRGDVHPLAEYRVDRTLRNIPEFARVFGCPKRDKNCVIYE